MPRVYILLNTIRNQVRSRGSVMTSDHLVPSEMQFWSSLTQYAPQIPFLEVFLEEW